MTIDTRPAGRTAARLTTLGLGTATLGGNVRPPISNADAAAIVDRAYERGIRFFDTAPYYGYGRSERLVGDTLRGRSGWVLSTKAGRLLRPRTTPQDAGDQWIDPLPFEHVYDYSYDGVMRSFEQSLLRLGTDRIDILLIHDIDAWSQGEDMVEARYREAIGSGYRALDELRSSGTVKAIGLGLDDHDWCERFLREAEFDAVLLAGRYSLLEQPALPTLLPLALEQGVGIMLGGIFNSGILATGAVPGARYNYEAAPPEIMERVARIEAVCRAHSVSLPRAAVQFVLGHPAVSSLVLGAVKPAEIARNLAALDEPVPDGLWSDLKTEGLLDPDAPTPNKKPQRENA